MAGNDRDLQNENLELSRVITDWHEYSGVPIEVIMSNIAGCRQRIGDDWRTTVTTAKDDEISKSYEQLENYIYDILTSFTQQETPIKLCNYRRILAFIRHLAMRRRVNVLEFGGGAVELSLLMWEAGATITYCDLHGRISDFAVWRFKKHGADIKDMHLNGTRCLFLSTLRSELRVTYSGKPWISMPEWKSALRIRPSLTLHA